MTIQTIGLDEARDKLGTLVSQAQFSNTATTITRNRKPVARIVPIETAEPATGHNPDTEGA